MKRILLIGKTDEVYKELAAGLSGLYTVRFGTSSVLGVTAVLKTAKPQLIVLRLSDIGEKILPVLSSECGGIPVIVVGEADADIVRSLPSGYISCPDSAEDILPAVKETLSSREDDASPSVMVIDDDPAMLRMIKAMIGDEYELVLAPSGKKALALTEKKCPDIILLDYEMPEMNGIQTLEALRRDKRLADIPVIFLTGTVSPDIMENIRAADPAGFLVKPADAPDIKSAIKKAVLKISENPGTE